MPRSHGRSEDSTIENKVIREVKLEKPEEMSRRICETGGKSHQNVLTLQPRLYDKKIGSPVTRRKPSEKNPSSRVLTMSNVRDRQLVPNRIYLKWYTTYFHCFVPIIYIYIYTEALWPVTAPNKYLSYCLSNK